MLSIDPEAEVFPEVVEEKTYENCSPDGFEVEEPIEPQDYELD